MDDDDNKVSTCSRSSSRPLRAPLLPLGLLLLPSEPFFLHPIANWLLPRASEACRIGGACVKQPSEQRTEHKLRRPGKGSFPRELTPWQTPAPAVPSEDTPNLNLVFLHSVFRALLYASHRQPYFANSLFPSYQQFSAPFLSGPSSATTAAAAAVLPSRPTFAWFASLIACLSESQASTRRLVLPATTQPPATIRITTCNTGSEQIVAPRFVSPVLTSSVRRKPMAISYRQDVCIADIQRACLCRYLR